MKDKASQEIILTDEYIDAHEDNLINFLTSLKNEGKDLNQPLQLGEYTGYTPLHIACLKGNLKATEFLLAEKVDATVALQTGPYKGFRAAALAARSGNVEIIQLLWPEDVEVNQKITFGDYAEYTPFHIACIHGHAEAADLIQECDTELDSTIALQVGPYKGFHPAAFAAQNPNSGLISRLLDDGFNPDQLIPSGKYKGYTMLHIACLFEVLKTIQ